MRRIFLLSPANTGGERARLLLRENARSEIAQRLRVTAAPLGEEFTFLSGLYFRGKVAYAKTFARPPASHPGAYVITSNSGLLDVDAPVDLDLLHSFSKVPVDVNEPRYRQPLLRDAKALAKILRTRDEVVLLGSIATPKYATILLEVFGERLLFPADFVGRGDLSRGGLMLRSAADRHELKYIPVLGAIRHGPKPERLVPRRYSAGQLNAPR